MQYFTIVLEFAVFWTSSFDTRYILFDYISFKRIYVWILEGLDNSIVNYDFWILKNKTIFFQNIYQKISFICDQLILHSNNSMFNFRIYFFHHKMLVIPLRIFFQSTLYFYMWLSVCTCSRKMTFYSTIIFCHFF